MKYILFALVIVTISLFTISIYEYLFNTKRIIKDRLRNVKSMFIDINEEISLRHPFEDRVIKPLYKKIVGFIGRATPYQIRLSIEKLINHAGFYNKITVDRFLTIELMLGLIFPSLLTLFLKNTEDSISFLLILLVGIIGFFLPVYVLRSKARGLQTKIQRALPDMLDLLYVSVEAGLGFDMALKRTTEKMPGPLSMEINRALDEISKGKNREDALRGIVNRTGVEDLSTFITAVIQSEKLGSNIANMLRIQSSSMRQKRRQRAEELAMKVPIKMLFPLVIFMLPALFIVILGPAVLRIIEIFKTMF